MDSFLRVPEFAQRSRMKEATVRKKILRREIGYCKVGKIVLIPESELNRVIGEYRPPIDRRRELR